MLNEMMVLRRTLRELGVSTKSRHPDIQMLGKGSPLLRVFLTFDGKVAAVEVVSKELAPEYWTFRDGNKNSFPHIRFKPAMRRGADQETISEMVKGRKSLKYRRDSYLALRERLPLTIEQTISWLGESHRSKIRDRGTAVRASSYPSAQIFAELVEAFLKTEDHALLVQIEAAAAEQLVTDPSDDLLLLASRLSFSEPRDSKDTKADCDVLFDFESSGDYSRAANPQMVAVLSSALASATVSDSETICALSGQSTQLVASTFPKARMGSLGPTVLFSRNEDIPSAHRYGFFDAASMPVGIKIASELQAAVEELVSGDREQKTWTKIPSEKPKKKNKPSPLDLLVCHIPALPDLGIVNALALSEASFEVLGHRIAELTTGTNGYIPPSARIDIFIFRRIDKGNVKTIFSSSVTLEAFQAAIALWQQASGNTPLVSLLIPVKKGEAAVAFTPRTLTPGQIVRLTRQSYHHDGLDSYEASGLSFSEAFSLVMRTQANSQATLRRILRLALTRFAPLLIGIGHVRSRQFKSSSKPDMEAFKPESRRDALDAISLMGALLFQLDIKITKYMNTPAYLLGQLLAGSDFLHRGYCLDVRGGNLPPKLIGNTALTTAEKNPQSALNQLSRRWPPYNGWATKRRRDDFKQMIEQAKTEGDKGRLRMIRDGAWAPVNMAPLAAALAESLTDERPDDTFRAQLFLGYVAGLPRSE